MRICNVMLEIKGLKGTVSECQNYCCIVNSKYLFNDDIKNEGTVHVIIFMTEHQNFYSHSSTLRVSN